MSQKPVEEEIAFGLWQTHDGTMHKREIRDVAAFRERFGDAMIIGFAQMFAAADRIATFLYLIGLNGRRIPALSADKPETEHLPDSVATDRNRWTLVLQMIGAYHELHDAIATLSEANLTNLLKLGGEKVALGDWKKIRQISGRYETGWPERLRNQLAAHLGDRDVMREGLEKSAGGHLQFLMSDYASPAHTWFVLASDLLLRGLGITQNDFDKVATTARDDSEIGLLASNVFVAALRAKGAPIAKDHRWNKGGGNGT